MKNHSQAESILFQQTEYKGAWDLFFNTLNLDQM